MPGQNDFIYAAKVARTKNPPEAFYWLGTRPDVTIATATGTSHTASAAGRVILVDDDTAGSAVTVTLPVASADAVSYYVKKLGTTANVIVDGNGAETVDGAANATLTAQYEAILVVSDGTAWHIL